MPAPLRTAAEILLALAAATLAVAALEGAAPVTGLGVVYLLAVLAIAIRRGEVAALATAVAAVLALNYFFIEPRHRLTVADSHNVAALIVFLITAAVVGRLAAQTRQGAREAEVRAGEARAREREAGLLAEVASSLLAGQRGVLPLAGQPLDIPAAGARVDLRSAPAPRAGELAVPLPTRERSGWLYVEQASWQRADAERMAAPVADVLDMELHHRRVAETAAEADAARRGDVAKTAILHAISHDLRSPLTAITTAASALRAGGLSARGPR